jgi:hypothetical protein
MKGSGKVSVIFTSEMTEAFLRMAAQAKEVYSVVLHLAHIVGKRWEYAAGNTQSAGLDWTAERIPLGHAWGLIVYGWERLSPRDKATLMKAAQEFCARFSHFPEGVSK